MTVTAERVRLAADPHSIVSMVPTHLLHLAVTEIEQLVARLSGMQDLYVQACEQREDATARLASIAAAIEAWKRGDNDAGGCIAECERIATGAVNVLGKK